MPEGQTGCPFCDPEPERVFHRGTLVYGLWDRYPASPGHALLVPVRHIGTWFDAGAEERRELMDATDIARTHIEARHDPDGYNIGINAGAAAGQTVFHLHVHVIPRYRGDTEDPRGGVRHAVPGKGDYPRGNDSVSAPKVGDDAGVWYDARIVTGGESDPLIGALSGDMDRAIALDVAVAFVLPAGLALLEPHIEDLLARAGTVRFLTGDYLDATDPRALRRLLDLGERYPERVQLRVFETARQSFHPKAYLFAADAGSGTAYIGSSNLTRPALTDGIEWNYRLRARDDPAAFAQVYAAFAQLFHHPDTRPLDADWIERYERRRRRPQTHRTVEVAPEPTVPPEPNAVQREALEALEHTRAGGNTAALVVLGTGMGKTYLAALDSARPEFRRVLFVAHRDEILDQAARTFRMQQPEARLGFFTGRQRDARADLVFASVQTLGRARHIQSFAPDAFDYIVIDEFHHACAPTYRRIIDHFEPKFLLGLTATPERADGGDLLALCQENLVYRCDFVEGVRRGLLSPFHYFGVPDEVDYANIPWRSGRFEEQALTRHLATRARAENALDQYRQRAGHRTLAFCCSQRHADFMAEFFAERGVRVAAVHAGPKSDPRATSLERLRDGHIDVLFAVDMFNEGVDVPEIDTVLMLRPTESPVIWLQQIGRGLRRAPHKDHLRVIDYIGNHRTFLVKPQMLFQMQNAGEAEIARLLERIDAKELELPPGCEVTYETQAIDILRGLLRLRLDEEQALRLFYEDVAVRHGRRPLAVEAFHEGHGPRSSTKEHGSWLGFAKAMGGLTPEQHEALEAHGAFLKALEATAMTKSYKMLVLLAMLERDALPGGIGIDELTSGFRRLAKRSAKLRDDVSVPLDDFSALRRLIERNPVHFLERGEGMDNKRYFAYEDRVFRTTFDLQQDLRPAFRELAREVVDWRLAEYLERLSRRTAP